MSNSFRVVYEDFTDFGDELERNHSYWEERLAALESLFQSHCHWTATRGEESM